MGKCYVKAAMVKIMDEFFKANKEMWEAYVDIHETSEFYDLKGFLEGKQTLNPINQKPLLK